MAGHLVDLGFVCFLSTYCFVCPILLEQVGIKQNGQITLGTQKKSIGTKYIVIITTRQDVSLIITSGYGMGEHCPYLPINNFSAPK